MAASIIMGGDFSIIYVILNLSISLTNNEKILKKENYHLFFLLIGVDFVLPLTFPLYTADKEENKLGHYP